MTKIFAALFFLVFSIEATLALNLSEYSYEAQLPLYDGDKNLGDVLVQIQGEELAWIKKKSLIQVLERYVKSDTLEALKKLPEELNPKNIPFAISFNPQELRLITFLDLKLRATSKTDLGIDLSEEKEIAIKTSPFGGAINYRLEKNWGHEKLGGEFFDAQFNSFINLHDLVFENQTFYQDNKESPWFRGDTRLVKDFQKQNIRAQLGDVYPQIQGFMAASPLGGINIARNFALNPYRLPYPTGNQNFVLKSRSFVKYFVNSVMVKSEYLPAGNYNAKDIPLNNGLNTIVIEATDDLGQKQVFVFRSSSSITLLNEGESRFDLSYGVPFNDLATRRDYVEEDGNIFSGFFQYGFSSQFSSSIYLQTQKEFVLSGAELIQATNLGNFTLGGARSELAGKNGLATALGYQLITQGRKWFDSHTLNLRFENRGKDFKSTSFDFSSAVQNAYAANYSIPLSNIATVSLGGNYGDVRNNDLENRYGMDANISLRVLNQHNISFYLSRNRDELRKWNDVAYVFFTFMFPESNNFVSGLYDYNKESIRATLLRDNQNRLYKTRAQAQAEYASTSQSGELDLSYPTPIGDVGGRITGLRETSSNDTFARGSARVNSALVFAYDDGEFGGGISRPVPGSFVLFKPEPRLHDQKIALKSTSPYSEGESGLFNEIVFSNLLPYQYRDIQLDPTMMDIGRSLQKEKFMLFPTYRSAHLIKLMERGTVVLTGRILLPDGSAASLQVGRINGLPFFTNRDGAIYIEGAEGQNFELLLDSSSEKINIKIDKDQRGLVNLGDLQLKGQL